MRLEAGDILLIRHGDAYVMSSSAQMCAAARFEMEPSLQFFRQMRRGLQFRRRGGRQRGGIDACVLRVSRF